MDCLITGAAGFVGRHLTAHLRGSGHRVSAIVHPEADLRGVDCGEGTVSPCDILDGERVAALIKDSSPDVVFHLAAFSNPQDSRLQTRLTLETNIIGTEHVLRSAQQSNPATRVLLVGSAQEYGQVPEAEQPIQEDRALSPLTPYSVSKAAQELLGVRYFTAEKLPVYMTRSFNHTGPGQSDAYVCSNFAKQIAEMEELGAPATLSVGNLAARRDFTDVRDVVAAYVLIVEQARPGRVYNVCRGEAFSIESLVEMLCEESTVSVEVEVDPERHHALDAPLILGDNRRLKEDTNWTPQLAMRQTMRDLLSDWRSRLSS